jgi:hypothetical protein
MTSFLLLISLANASSIRNETTGNQTNWFVDITEGIGSNSGDSYKYQNSTTQNNTGQTSTNQTFVNSNRSRKLNNSLVFYDSVSVSLSVSEPINENTIVENTTIVENITDISEVPKEQIDWSPYVVWGMIILFTLALIGGAWYVYQVYFY